MDDLFIQFSDDYEDISAIHDALYNYNLEKTQTERKEVHASRHPEQHALVVRNSSNEFCGGLVFHHTHLPEGLFVELFFIDDSLRGQGAGKKVFEELLKYASEKKLSEIRLTTNTFQAPGFYEKLGFVITDEKSSPSPGCPENICYSLVKKL